MKKIYFLIVLIVLLLIGIVFIYPKNKPTADLQSKINVITTLFPTYDFVRQIGGDRVNVSLLLPPGVEPHAFEPTPKDIIKINNSKIFVYTGKYMEPWVNDVLKSINTTNVIVIDASKHVNILKAGEEELQNMETQSDGIDPHIWLDFDNVQIIIDDIVIALSQSDPNNDNYYQNNARVYKQKILSLDERYKTELSRCLYKQFFHGGHYAFGYLAHRYNLQYISTQGFSPDSEPTPQQLIELTNQINRLGVKYLYYEELVDPRIARTVASETNTKLLKIDSAHNIPKEKLSDGITYERIMIDNLNQLKTGLECL